MPIAKTPFTNTRVFLKLIKWKVQERILRHGFKKKVELSIRSPDALTHPLHEKKASWDRAAPSSEGLRLKLCWSVWRQEGNPFGQNFLLYMVDVFYHGQLMQIHIQWYVLKHENPEGWKFLPYTTNMIFPSWCARVVLFLQKGLKKNIGKFQ